MVPSTLFGNILATNFLKCNLLLGGRGWGCNVFWVVLVWVVCSAVGRLNAAGVTYANLCKGRHLVLEFFFLVSLSFSSCCSLPILFFLVFFFCPSPCSTHILRVLPAKRAWEPQHLRGAPIFVVRGGDKSPHSAASSPGPRFPVASPPKQPCHLVQVTSLRASVS